MNEPMMTISYYEACVTYALKHKNIQAATLEEAGLCVYHRYDFKPSGDKLLTLLQYKANALRNNSGKCYNKREQ